MSPKNSSPVDAGRQKADEVIARRKLALARRAKALAAHPAPLSLNVSLAVRDKVATSAGLQTTGFLAAAGDSWFDYPFFDVIKLLEDDYGYNVESSAHRGDPIESMAYFGGQLDKFARCLEKLSAQGVTPKAILLSGGGDDIAGPEFGMLLNSSTSTISGWNKDILKGVLDERIAAAYTSMIAAIAHLCVNSFGKCPPLIVHGYDYPVPDGRGFWGGWPFPGPWLEPGFREKLFNDLRENTGLMHEVIDQFNLMLATLAANQSVPNIRYLDLRGTLSTDLANEAYKQSWGNEIHPTEDGFSAITAKFAALLATLP